MGGKGGGWEVGCITERVQTLNERHARNGHTSPETRLLDRSPTFPLVLLIE